MFNSSIRWRGEGGVSVYVLTHSKPQVTFEFADNCNSFIVVFIRKLKLNLKKNLLHYLKKQGQSLQIV